MKKNPEALALAFKKCRSKIQKIQALGITPDMPEEAQDKVINDLATARALQDGKTVDDVFEGQAWYVQNLIEFSGLSVENQLEAEYQDTFATTASEPELIDALKALVA